MKEEVCTNAMLRGKDISEDVREADVAAHPSGKDLKNIPKLCGTQRSAESRTVHKNIQDS